jgi:hypothetical protein
VLGNSTHGKGVKRAGSRIVLSRQSSLPVLMHTLHAALWLHGVVGPALKKLVWHIREFILYNPIHSGWYVGNVVDEGDALMKKTRAEGTCRSSVDTTYCPVYHISRTCLACSWCVMWLSCSSINAQGRSGSCTAILTHISYLEQEKH